MPKDRSCNANIFGIVNCKLGADKKSSPTFSKSKTSPMISERRSFNRGARLNSVYYRPIAA